MKKLLFYLILLFGLNSYAQITLIPDPNFEQALIDLNYDTAPINGSVPTANISGILNLQVQSKNISDLTGIHDFTSLTNLDCYSNQLTSLDLSGMTNLKFINCALNQLTSLNVSGSNSLERIICNFNSITSLNASGLSNLNEIQCQSNQLTSINITGTNLYSLQCGSNLLTNINVSGFNNLHTLHCGSNLFTNLNVSGLNNLLDLRFEFNQITSINLNGLTNLTSLDCRGNLLSCIDLTSKPSLVFLACFQSTSLTCIQVDNISQAQSNANWYKDATATYSLNCSPCTSGPCQTLYVDTDNDGYDNGSVVDCSGTLPLGYSLTTLGTDCDDSNTSITTSFSLPAGLQSGLLAQYTFNSGSTNDFSGNGHHLTNTSANSAADRNGNLNCAFEFDNLPSSNNQFLSAASSSFLNGLSEYSISCWYKAKDPSRGIVDYEVLVGRDTGALNCPDRIGQWSLGLYDCRFAVFGRENSVWQAPGAPCNEVEVWHHLTATYNQVGDTIKLYKDGILQNTSTGNAGCGSYSDIGDLFLGKGFTGILDDVFIHNREITAAEVTQLYGLGSSCCSTGTTVATCNGLFDDFNTSSLWVHPLTTYTCSADYNDLDISGGTFNFTNANDNHFNYMYRTGLVISDTNWKANIDFTPTAFGSGNGTGHVLLSLNSGTKSFFYDDTLLCFGGSAACSYSGLAPCTLSAQKGIALLYQSNLPSSPSSYSFEVRINDGLGTITNAALIATGDISGTGTYYPSIERTSATTGILNVYSDAARTTHIAGSPVVFSIPASIVGLNTAQIGVIEAGIIDRSLTGTLDNLCITNTTNPCTSVITPTFTAITSICYGDTLTALPISSNEGITGTWSPALDNTGTTTYTFTPDAGQCASPTTITIVVNPFIQPNFNIYPPLCQNGFAPSIPTVSLEGITGTWSPSFIDTSVTGFYLYVFTPDAGQCAIPTTMPILINPNDLPVFNPVAPICAGDALPVLPLASINGITGTWSPALDNTTTTTYIFTPDPGQCATTTTMTIVVNPTVQPNFLVYPPLCQNGIAPLMPTVSLEGFTGTWSPAFVDTTVVGTYLYVFTPDAGQCATTATMTITVNPPTTNITTITNCSSYTWPVNGVTYTTSGIYTDIVGCTIGLLYLTIEIPTTWYIDADGDGAGNPAISIVDCIQPTGYVNNDNDCDDTNATINPCAIENRTDGIDNNCNGIIDEIVTKLVNSQCNSNLSSLNQLLVAQSVSIPGSTICGYRFQVTKWVGGAPSTNPADIQTITRSVNTFALTMLANYAYNTTYSVQVAVCVNGVWQPYGADCCTVRCNKLSKVQAVQCGTTLSLMSDWVYADYYNFVKPASFVPTYVKPWRFEITQVTPGPGFGVVQTYDNQLNRFRMNDLASATYDTTYSVRVAFLNVDGTWSSFGIPCTITTPSFPTTQIQSSQCGFTASSGTQLIWANGIPTTVDVPTHYRFRLSNSSIPYSQTKDNTSKNFFLNQFIGLATNTTYDVEVSMEIRGVYGPYGAICTVTTPNVFREMPTIIETKTFDAVAYPNPAVESFQIEVTTESKEPIFIQVYDLLGRLVEDKQTTIDEFYNLQLGNSYPSGVYQVIVKQESNIKTLKVIKR